MSTYLHGADAAFASNIPPGYDIAFGYYGGPNAYHVWPETDWARFPGCKVPVWVGGLNGATEGASAKATLQGLGVPEGSVAVLDMETRIDVSYVNAFGAAISNRYKVWVYGSASTVFHNPQLNGYWVADYTANPVPTLQQVGVRAVQWAANWGNGYDVSLVKAWTTAFMWGGTTS